MVQSTLARGHGSQLETRNSHDQSEKIEYGRKGGGGDLKRMLKNSRSVRILEECLESPLADNLILLERPAASKKTGKKKMSPVRSIDTEPRYMKSTSSSNARKEKATVSSLSSSIVASELNPAKTQMRRSNLGSVRPPMKKRMGLLPSPEMVPRRATCSSTMKEKRFPSHLDLKPGVSEAEGTSVYKVCPYTYCSLNGHSHLPPPPLRSFISARRRLLKTQKSLTAKLLSLSDKEIDAEGAGCTGVSPSVVDPREEDFPVEIYANYPNDGLDEVNSDSGGEKTAEIGEHDGNLSDDSPSDEGFARSWDFSPSEMEVLVDFLEYVECDGEGAERSPRRPTKADGGWRCGRLEMNGENTAEDDNSYVDFEEIDHSEFAEEESTHGISFETGPPHYENVGEAEAGQLGAELNSNFEVSDEMICPTSGDVPIRAPAATSVELDGDPGDLRLYNQRAPKFLPEEPDPEAEKVDLRHQLPEDRRNSEEWMVDYALRRAVDNLAPRRKKKVALLVEAFETVLPTPPSSDSGLSKPPPE
ncbi:unnamed protein product [Spirodela intermedia]|uniref:Calmodulin-binding domain-containing protein n=1 Tax=Spirodela intermedia TaxID=51605 RepID=A0A7I8KN39_SPIIN|nr:unnamed protein product [Spirodela intermedia]